MPYPQRRRLLLSGGDEVLYLLRDEFTDTLAAGSVNGTPATPTGGARTVVDTNSKISVAASVLSFATGAVANDGVWWSVNSRTAGRLLLARVTPSDTNGIAVIGWDSNQSGAILDSIRFAAAGAIQIVANGGTAISVGTYTATPYVVAGILRATGAYWFIKGGAFAQYTQLFSTSLGSAAAYPSVQAGGATSVFTVG